MKVSGQRHAPATLPPGKEPAPTESINTYAIQLSIVGLLEITQK